jgi:hypothetical protein
VSAADTKALFGRVFGGHDFLMLFSMRIDETGTDGTSDFMTIGGAVATVPLWDALEEGWNCYLNQKGVPAFHLKEFDQRSGPFDNWGDLKCQYFERHLRKIIKDNTTFRVAVSIDSLAHKSVKDRMRGIKGFSADSDYTLCLRFLMFHACEQLTKFDAECRLSIIVEDGPWASGAMALYQRVAAMTGKWKPAKHAHRLVGFGSQPKGILRSLEAADYIVGREHERLVAKRKVPQNDTVLSHLLSASDLEGWYEGMIREKEDRRSHALRSRGGGPSM